MSLSQALNQFAQNLGRYPLLLAITAITLAARNANNGGNAANADGSRNSAAVCYLLLATALSATAFVIAFTLA